MNIEEIKVFAGSHLDLLTYYKGILVRVVGWSWAYKSLFFVVSVDQSNPTKNLDAKGPCWEWKSRDLKKDIFLSKRNLTAYKFWYILPDQIKDNKFFTANNIPPNNAK